MSEQRKLIIIDDDPDYVDGIKAILEKAGYQVDAAYSPKAGWQALQSKRYDLLLLDVMMGRGAEGVMLARRMRKDARLKEMPVLIITGIREQIAFLFPGEPMHPHFFPVDELVEKPVEPKTLLEKVSALLQADQARKDRITA
jgi:two-component system alkaline phosphatase synthesis response regulator PhoP